MATIWKGTISFGLVNIPVHLEAAVRRGASVSFRQLHRDDLAPIKMERVCSRDGEPVPWSDVVKGYEYAPDQFVVIDKEDLEAARPPKSKLFEISDFVAAEELDARYFETPYFLLPDGPDAKAYVLLREAIRESGMVGIGTITLRERQHLAAIRTVGDALVLELMRFAHELVDVDAYQFPPADAVRPQELTMARQLIGNLAERFAPEKYRDEYHERVMAVIARKLKGEKVRPAELEEPSGTRVVDLMERLRESLSLEKADRARPARGKRPPAAKRKRSASRGASRGATPKGRATTARGASKRRRSA